jgi:hypothetical protein
MCLGDASANLPPFLESAWRYGITKIVPSLRQKFCVDAGVMMSSGKSQPEAVLTLSGVVEQPKIPGE